MSKTIAVIDYGMGNLRSVSKALEYVAGTDHRVLVTDDPDIILSADRVVFPGQGAARDCMNAISEHHLNQAILGAARSKPFLGICMGLQVLMTFSEENQGTPLMGLFPGDVKRFPELRDADGMRLKIPQMGWNQVKQVSTHPLWDGIDDDSRFYFVHSYYVTSADGNDLAATSRHGVSFAAALAHENIFAAQFHPEKSQHAGLQLYDNFLRWNGEA